MISEESKYGTSVMYVQWMFLQWKAWTQSSVVSVSSLREKMESTLWWPPWEDVPLDLYLSSRTLFAGGRQFRYELRSDGFVKYAVAPNPGADIRREDLESPIGAAQGEYDPQSRGAKELRTREENLSDLKKSILCLLQESDGRSTAGDGIRIP